MTIKANLTAAQIEVLATVLQHPKECTPLELAAIVKKERGHSRALVYAALARLETSGFVKTEYREPVQGTRGAPSRNVKLTKMGVEAMQQYNELRRNNPFGHLIAA